MDANLSRESKQKNAYILTGRDWLYHCKKVKKQWSGINALSLSDKWYVTISSIWGETIRKCPIPLFYCVIYIAV